MKANTEARLAALEASNLAVQHALGAVFTAIAELDSEVAAGIPALLDDMIAACRERGTEGEMAAVALENIAEVAVAAAFRGR